MPKQGRSTPEEPAIFRDLVAEAWLRLMAAVEADSFGRRPMIMESGEQDDQLFASWVQALRLYIAASSGWMMSCAAGLADRSSKVWSKCLAFAPRIAM